MRDLQGAPQGGWPRVYKQPLQVPLTVVLVLFGAQAVWIVGGIVFGGGDGVWLAPFLIVLPALLLYFFTKIFQHVTLDREFVEFRSRLTRVRIPPSEIIAIESDRIRRPSVSYEGGRLILGIGGKQLQNFLRDVKKVNPAVRVGPAQDASSGT